jgi:hypothetical protein
MPKMGFRLREPFFLSLLDLNMLTNDFFVWFIQETTTGVGQSGWELWAFPLQENSGMPVNKRGKDASRGSKIHSGTSLALYEAN